MLVDDDKDPAHFFLVGLLKSSLEDYLGSINNIFAAMTARLDAETTRSLEAASQTRAINLIIGFIALLVAMGSAVLMVRTVAKQLGGEVFEAGNIAQEISEGNLSVNFSFVTEIRPACWHRSSQCATGYVPWPVKFKVAPGK